MTFCRKFSQKKNAPPNIELSVQYLEVHYIFFRIVSQHNSELNSQSLLGFIIEYILYQLCMP